MTRMRSQKIDGEDNTTQHTYKKIAESNFGRETRNIINKINRQSIYTTIPKITHAIPDLLSPLKGSQWSGRLIVLLPVFVLTDWLPPCKFVRCRRFFGPLGSLCLAAGQRKECSRDPSEVRVSNLRWVGGIPSQTN